MHLGQATLFQPFIFQATPRPSKEQIATVVAITCKLFMPAYCVEYRGPFTIMPGIARAPPPIIAEKCAN